MHQYLVSDAASPAPAPRSTNTGAPDVDVHDARGLPRDVLALQATSPNSFAVSALDGHRFAWVKPAGPSGPDSLLVADPLTVQDWFKDEWPTGSVTGWPETISKCRSLQC
jgi:hypothetical protein